MCQHSTAFILAPPENLVPIINATAAAKCQFVHPHPIGFFSAPQFERQSFFPSEHHLLELDSLAMIAWNSLPASFIISSLRLLSPLTLSITPSLPSSAQ